MRLVTVSQLNNKPYIATVFYDRFVTQLTSGLGEDNHLRTMVDFIRGGSSVWNESYARAKIPTDTAVMLKKCKLHAPITPRSLRDFYAFEEHVKTANTNRGREVPKEWYEVPVFYYSNTTTVFGTEEIIPYPSKSDALDYELEIACVIGKEGRDIPVEKAEEYIFGYMIFNDWSARDIQKQEMAVGLGPAKGKDFASSFGPYLVTSDELTEHHAGRPGVYDLKMIARVNDKEYSRGNMKDMHWSFGELIARASQDVTLYPGDVIASGTVGSGCLLELTKGEGPWLQPGDVVELEIEHLGILRNIVGGRGSTGEIVQRQTTEQSGVLLVTPVAEIVTQSTESVLSARPQPAAEPTTTKHLTQAVPASVAADAAAKADENSPEGLTVIGVDDPFRTGKISTTAKTTQLAPPDTKPTAETKPAADTEPFDQSVVQSAVERAEQAANQTSAATSSPSTTQPTNLPNAQHTEQNPANRPPDAAVEDKTTIPLSDEAAKPAPIQTDKLVDRVTLTESAGSTPAAPSVEDTSGGSTANTTTPTSDTDEKSKETTND